MNVLKPYERDSVLTLIRAKLSFRDIERRLGIRRETISRYAQEAGLFDGKSKPATSKGVATGDIIEKPEAEGREGPCPPASGSSSLVVVKIPKLA